MTKAAIAVYNFENCFGAAALRIVYIFLVFISISVFGQITEHGFHEYSLSVEVISKRDDSGPVVLGSDRGELYIFPKDHERQKLWNLLSEWSPRHRFAAWQTKSEPSTLIAIKNLNTGSIVFAYTTDAPPPFEQKTVQLLGERCSGTTFCQQILQNHLSIHFKWKYGWKHFPIWFSKEDKWQRDTETLFIVIFRKPYDWLRSFYLMPYHVLPPLKKGSGASFFKFISSQWYSLHEITDPPEKVDLNPEDNAPFENILKMRSAKVRDFLELEKAPNHFFLRYEDLKKTPYLFIMELAQHFKLRVSALYSPINKHVKRSAPMPQKQIYFPLTIFQKKFIDSELDWDLEREIGYSCTDHP